MSTNTNPISVTYSDEKLRILVEEYITQQINEFTFRGVCSYILYWAMGDGKVTNQGTLYEGNQLAQTNCDSISCVLDKIVSEGRIAFIGGEDELFVKQWCQTN